MTTITERQYDSLKDKIYSLLISNDEMDMGDMGNCMDAASNLVTEWMDENNIVITD